jgi:hypothetical protein
MRATRRKRPEQRGQQRASTEKVRIVSSAPRPHGVKAGRRRRRAEPRQERHHLVEDGFEQSVIARVKALRAEGHAMTRIAKALDARSGRPWHPQQVARIVK